MVIGRFEALLGLIVTIAMLLILFSSGVLATSSSATAAAFGVKELKTVEITLFANTSVPTDTNFSVILDFDGDFTDGADRIVSLSLRTVLDKVIAQPLDTFYFVNDTACPGTPITTSLGQTQYVAEAKCDDLFNLTQDKVYNVTFGFDNPPNSNLENVLFRVFITYINDPDFTDLNQAFDEIELIFAKVYEDNILHNTDFCIDNETSRKQLELFTGNVTSNTTTTKFIDTHCDLGCSNQTGKCNAPEFQSTILGLLIIIAIIVVGYILLRRR